MGASKKYKAHISKYVRHILKYLRHIFLPSENPLENRDKNKDKNGRRIMHCLMQTVRYPCERYFYTLYAISCARRIIVQINGGKLYQKDESCRY